MIILSLQSCGHRQKCDELQVYFNSATNQQFTLGCGELTYFRPTPKCYLAGKYQALDNNYLAWDLKELCFDKTPATELCYLNINGNEAELSCQDIGIHAIFERIK